MQKILRLLSVAALSALLVFTATPANASVLPGSAQTSVITAVGDVAVADGSGQYLLNPKVNGKARNLRVAYLAFDSSDAAAEFAADFRADFKGNGYRIVVGSDYVIVLGQFLSGGPDTLNAYEQSRWNGYASRFASKHGASAPLL